jgi:hypothetical protein
LVFLNQPAQADVCEELATGAETWADLARWLDDLLAAQGNLTDEQAAWFDERITENVSTTTDWAEFLQQAGSSSQQQMGQSLARSVQLLAGAETFDEITGAFNAITGDLASITDECQAQIGSQEEAAEDNSIWFDGEQYQLAWTGDGPAIFYEYLRAGETVESWTRMLTFSVAEGTGSGIKEQYLEQRRHLMLFEPDILTASNSEYTEDLIITLVLQAPSQPDAEFVMTRLVADPGEPVRLLTFSMKLAPEDAGSAFEVMDAWINELGGFLLGDPAGD